jgi:hypothetical protein
MIQAFGVRQLAIGTGVMLLCMSVSSCAATVSAGEREDRRESAYRERYVEDDAAPLGVPRGHLPPPGECRIWYPRRPPGQQPPPMRCSRAMVDAPAGTWVLYRPDREEVHARVIDERRPGVVVRVRIYDADRGRYLRSERR